MPNRERWLQRAAYTMQGWLQAVTDEGQPEVFVSMGFGGTATGCQLDKVLGACWVLEHSRSHIFVSPVVSGQPWERQGVLHVLLHELCHAGSREPAHMRRFISYARAVGLLRPWRTTPDFSFDLAQRFKQLAQELGEWEHEPLTVPRKTTELTVGRSRGDARTARIIIPSERRDGTPLPDYFISDILLEAAKLFGGYTEWAACGGYVQAAGHVQQEKVSVVDIAAGISARPALERLAKQIKETGDQESVYLRLPNGRVEFV